MQRKQQGFGTLGFIILLVIAITLLLVGYEIYAHNFKSENSNNVTNAKSLVINSVGAPADLVDNLASNSEGCEKVPSYGKNTYYILAIDEKKGLAEVKYGCPIADATMDLRKTNGQWQTISPTGNFIYGIPLCSYIKKEKIDSHKVAPICLNVMMAKDKPGEVIFNPLVR